MKRIAFPILILFLLLSLSEFLTADGLTPKTIPFQLHCRHMIIVSGHIGSLGDLNFVIDTGASRTFLDRSVAKKLGLEGDEQEVTAYGRKQKVRMARIPTLRVGDFDFAEVDVQIADFAFRGRERQICVDGLIGLDLMKRISLSIDFVAQQITFGPVNHTKSSFPFYGRLPLIPVSVSVGTELLSLCLDTGAEFLILYQLRTVGRVPMRRTGELLEIRCLGRKAKLKQVHLQDVKLGSSAWEKLEAYVLDVRCPKSGPDGVLGVASLGLKQLNLDFHNNIVSWSQ